MTKRCILKVQDGSIMVVALVMLVFLTLLGIAATTTSETEIRIAGNEKVSKENFYRAEGAALAGAQEVENTDSSILDSHSPGWLYLTLPHGNIENETYWQGTNSATAIDNGNRYLALEGGIAPGSALGLELATRLHQVSVYGFSAIHNRQCLVEVGLKTRF